MMCCVLCGYHREYVHTYHGWGGRMALLLVGAMRIFACVLTRGTEHATEKGAPNFLSGLEIFYFSFLVHIMRFVPKVRTTRRTSRV